MDNNRKFTWRIWVAVTLTSLGVLYYLFFLAHLAAGIPIEKIHNRMTDGWPAFCADNVPLVAPLFLFLGLYLWYSHTVKSRPKPVFEPEYAFEFKMVDKNADAAVEDGEQELVQEPKLQVHSEIEETVEPQLKSKTATLIPKAKLEAEPQLHLEPESESLPDHYVFGRTINKSTT